MSNKNGAYFMRKTNVWLLATIAYLCTCTGYTIAKVGTVLPDDHTPVSWLSALNVVFVIFWPALFGFLAGRDSKN